MTTCSTHTGPKVQNSTDQESESFKWVTASYPAEATKTLLGKSVTLKETSINQGLFTKDVFKAELSKLTITSIPSPCHWQANGGIYLENVEALGTLCSKALTEFVKVSKNQTFLASAPLDFELLWSNWEMRWKNINEIIVKAKTSITDAKPLLNDTPDTSFPGTASILFQDNQIIIDISTAILDKEQRIIYIPPTLFEKSQSLKTSFKVQIKSEKPISRNETLVFWTDRSLVGELHWTWETQELKNKMIWFFPEATRIQLKDAKWLGWIVAPKAKLSLANSSWNGGWVGSSLESKESNIQFAPLQPNWLHDTLP